MQSCGKVGVAEGGRGSGGRCMAVGLTNHAALVATGALRVVDQCAETFFFPFRAARVLVVE